MRTDLKPLVLAAAMLGPATTGLASGHGVLSIHVADVTRDDNQVAIKNFNFQPMAISIPVGGTVIWRNLDGEPHTVTSTSGAFRSEALDHNDAYSFRFTKPGVYAYICTLHPMMRGVVTVR